MAAKKSLLLPVWPTQRFLLNLAPMTTFTDATMETPAMTRLLVAALIALVSSQVFAMDSLSELTWKNRIIIVFGDVSDQRVAQQIKILTDQRSELGERDLVVIGVNDDDAKAFFGSVSKLDVAALRREADIKKDRFQVVLVGKDGGIKLRSDTVVNDVDMFDVIDRMPMRRAERG
jgi:hypothetical protein